MNLSSIDARIVLAQTLDSNGEHQAADIVDSTITEPKRYNLSKLRQVFEALDFKLTGNARREQERPKSDKDILEALYEGREYYLNDGGYSRVVLRPIAPDYDKLRVFYTSNSTDKVKNAWESATVEIQAVESAANELYNDEAHQALTML
jgi:ribosomal protein L17